MSNEYVTVFPLTENPISEGSRWTNGLATGLDWHNCRTTGGKVCGTQSGLTTFDDSIAVADGVPVWSATQVARATASISNPISAPHSAAGVIEEIELLLRFTITAHSATGYEATFGIDPNNPYVQINRWNGAVNNFTTIATADATALSALGISSIANGDILKASICGKYIELFINDKRVLTVDDTTYTTGTPGVGFYYVNASSLGTYAPTDYGFTKVTLTNYAWANAACFLNTHQTNPGASQWALASGLSYTPPAGASIIATIDTALVGALCQVTSVTDSAGNTYYKDTNFGANQGAYFEELSVWRAIANGSAVTSYTIKFNQNMTANANIGICAETFGGILNASGAGAALDVNQIQAQSGTTTVDSGTAAGTTDTDFELKLGIYGDAGNNEATLTAGTVDTAYNLLHADIAVSGIDETAMEYHDAGAAGSTARAQFVLAATGICMVGVLVYRVAGGPPRAIKQGDFPKFLLLPNAGHDRGGVR